MKTKNLFLGAVITMLALTSCDSDDITGGSGNQDSSVRFTSTITNLDSTSPQTRAAGILWDKNDAIGVYMVKNGQGLTPATALAQNKHYTTENEGASGIFAPADASSAITYPEDGSQVDFISYYPYKTSVTDYKYPVDVTDQTSQPAIDLLYSDNATGLDKNTSNVSLMFKHKLSKVIFNVTSDDISDLSGLAITIKGTKTKASFNLAGGSSPLVVDESSVADILAKVSTDGKAGEAIILLSDGIDGRSFIFVLPSGTSFVWEVPATAIYEEGKKYTYNVKLQKSGSGSGEVKIEINDAQITDWIEAPSENIVPAENEEEGPVVGNVELDKLYGYGEGTTGGEGGTVYHFDDGKKFTAWLKLREKYTSTEPAIVWLSGTFTKTDGRDDTHPWFDIKRTSNITIYGVNGFKMQNVGFFLSYAENIIIRNVYIALPKADNGADGISMQNSNRVWVDHCTFESEHPENKDYEDGSCDITHGTKNVTVSWNHFIKTQKTCLVGHSDGQSSDSQITATFHHNFFDLSNSRHPRVRYGTVHVYNNFYNQVSTYGVGSAYGAMVLVENNSFDGVHLPTDICTYPAKSGNVSNLTGSVAGYLYAADNEYTNIPANASNPYPFTNVEYKAYNGEKLAQALTRADFTPAYTYVVDAATDVSTIVRSGSGAGVLSRFATAPIPVDNAGMPDTGDGDGGDDGNGDEDTPLGGGWAATNVGDASGKNVVGEDNSSITMTGKGKFESGAQAFNYVYQEVTGDFEMTVQLDSYVTTGTTNQALAGILLTPNLSVSGTEFIFGMCAQGGNSMYNYSHRITSGANSARGTIGSLVDGAVILKLRRVGNIYYASYSTDGGANFSSEKNGTFTNALPDKLYVGLAVNSASNSETSTAKFSNIKINGISATFAD